MHSRICSAMPGASTMFWMSNFYSATRTLQLSVINLQFMYDEQTAEYNGKSSLKIPNLVLHSLIVKNIFNYFMIKLAQHCILITVHIIFSNTYIDKSSSSSNIKYTSRSYTYTRLVGQPLLLNIPLLW